jgi:hypothetical protein
MIAFHSAHHPFLSYCVQVFISLLILAFALKASAEKKIRYKHTDRDGVGVLDGGGIFLALPSDLFWPGWSVSGWRTSVTCPPFSRTAVRSNTASRFFWLRDMGAY